MEYFTKKDVIVAELGGGIIRKVLAHSDKVTVCEFFVPAGRQIPMHAHPHEQFSTVISGVGEYIIGDKSMILKAGETAYMPPNVPHRVNILEDAVAIDVFSPARLDFLK